MRSILLTNAIVVSILAFALFLQGAVAEAGWDEACVRSGFGYWETGENWATILVFVNGSEVYDETIYIRCFDTNGNQCSSTTEDAYTIRAGEMQVFSTSRHLETYIPTTASYGYILFRVEDGGAIHAYCVIYNFMTGTGYSIPAFRPEDLF
ncbi:MAG: hypothetical protein JW941_11785 [Candidatus Coatesbacteria bacterium]|nr:hypothetical protein [Candidatus Coatesbacteria bacterium]